MQITEVKVFPIQEEKLRAFVSVVFDGCFMVNDIKVICGRDGLFISMPSRKKKNGEFKDVAHPLNNDTRRMLEGEILAEYERVLAERGESPPPSRPRRLPESPAAVPVAPKPRRPAVEPPAAVAAASSPSGELERAAAEEKPAKEKSLEEVEAQHLRDSFWSVS